MFKQKGFLPYLLIIFFNAFVDLGHKILIQNTLYQTSGANQFSLMSSVINALMLLPYIFLFTPSGFVADKYKKTSVLRITAAAAIPLTLLVTWSYYHGYFDLAFILTLLLATQSAINSPAKYGYIKEIFGKANIAQANAFVQTIAILSILIGTFAFSILFNHYISSNFLQHTTDKSAVLKAFAPAGLILILSSIAETLCTFIIPEKKAADAESHFEFSQYIKAGYLKQYVYEAYKTPTILLCILGLSLFWGINQVLLATYGAYLKAYAGNPSTVFVQGALGLGGIGILLGASYAGRVSRGYIESGLIPFAAIGMAIGIFFLSHLTNHNSILIMFVLYGAFGGMLIVPLNALVQFNAKDSHLGKVMATNNFIQTVFMLGFLLLNILIVHIGGGILPMLYILLLTAITGTVFAVAALPQALIRYVLYLTISKVYRIKVYGLDNLPSTGGILLLGNHTSFLDWALLGIASPRPLRFVIHRSYYEKWYLKWVLTKMGVIPISSGGSQQAIKLISEALSNGDAVTLFPEGRLSKNGQIGHFNSGYERAIANTGAKIIPFYLLGLWGASSSHATSRYKTVSKIKKRRISVSFGSELSGDTSAEKLKQTVMRLSITAWHNHTASLGTIAEEWLNRVKQLPQTTCIIDSNGTKLTQSQLLSTVMYIKNKLSSVLAKQRNIGILLPTGAAGVIANLSVFALGKTVVNLNYTTTTKNILSAIEDANINTIITARPFIKKLKDKGFDLLPALQKVTVIYIEDYKRFSSKVNIITNYLLVHLLPIWVLKKVVLRQQDNSKTAAIIFSSGSESKPKGVELTHQNIVCNAKQVSSIFNIEDSDKLLSTLPLFHAFGLTTTTIMPLIEGTPIICHPDPTDVAKIARLIYSHSITIMCGTATLFGFYCRNKKVLPQMLSSLHFVIAGAEKLTDKVRRNFKQKFNLNIYEGYGTTEVAPVASCNLPNILDPSDWHLQQSTKVGSVGLPLPGSAFKIVDPGTLLELPTGDAGMILIGGPQVMKGYLNNREKSNQVLIKDNDIKWYVTGDKGYLDETGFLTIIDRYSRFAKIAGEMVSLSVVEQLIESTIEDPETEIMALNIADDKKGEKIIVLHAGDIDTDAIRTAIIKSGNNLLLPSDYIAITSLPKLGAGKKDYTKAKQIIKDALD